MRISDWSSDVCSSDLLLHGIDDPAKLVKALAGDGHPFSHVGGSSAQSPPQAAQGAQDDDSGYLGDQSARRSSRPLYGLPAAYPRTPTGARSRQTGGASRPARDRNSVV